jgi:hypothetical protein
MTFQEFLNQVDDYYQQHKNDDMRYGQSIMNLLFQHWPSKYTEISGTDDDCFYDDSLVKFTLDKLEKEWAGQIIV